MSSQENENDQNGSEGEKRMFGCPCGKMYLSYPALFTHVRQKHDGNPPGDLIKPKANKTRGRPRIHINISQEELKDDEFDVQSQIFKALLPIQTDYLQQPAQSRQKNCEGMVTDFINSLPKLLKQGEPQSHELFRKRNLNCFLSYLKFFVGEKYGDAFWEEEKPTQIIDIANQICLSHEKHEQQFPIKKEIVVNMIYVLFKWMYQEKWTNDKLFWRKKPSSGINTVNSSHKKQVNQYRSPQKKANGENERKGISRQNKQNAENS